MSSARLPRLLTGKDVMSELAAILPRQGATMAAIAYVTHDHLGFRSQDDVLVVNAGLAAIRAGATNPSVLLQLVGRNVLVVNQPELHAKAVVRGNIVAVGSANLSKRTLALHELMWVTRDESLRAKTREWIGKLAESGEALDAERLRRLKKEFRKDAAPRNGSPEEGHEPAGPALADDPFAPSRVNRLWLWTPEPTSPDTPRSPNEPTSMLDRHPALSGTEWVLNSGSASTRVGDVWIRYGRKLHPPRRVLLPRSRTSSGGEHWSLVGFRRGDRPVAIPPWVHQKYSERVRSRDVLITDERLKRRLLSLWSESRAANRRA